MAEDNEVDPPIPHWRYSSMLYDGEEEDIRAEIRRVLGFDDAAEWLRTPNVRFGGLTPEAVIESGQVGWIRDVLRSYLYVGCS
jgi:hypothetical protein